MHELHSKKHTAVLLAKLLCAIDMELMLEAWIAPPDPKLACANQAAAALSKCAHAFEYTGVSIEHISPKIECSEGM